MAISLQSIDYDSVFTEEPKLTPVSQTIRRVAIVDDCRVDYQLLKLQLEKAEDHLHIEYYSTLAEFLDEATSSPDAVILDRHLPETGLSEGRIREIRARHKNCGVIIHTGVMTPSLRSTASHEGAIAVIEKGTLDAAAIELLIETAAVLGPQIHLPGER
ncbi:response regulator [Hirschia litorea]|uniref:Response regulator n=1 Tax=Hirschia litorea TaxID=1199156 RepID=A0ABW2IMN9_9PROT